MLMLCKLFCLGLEFLRQYCEIITSINVPARLPHHRDVILRSSDEVETFLRVWTPREIRRAIAVSTMNEQELRGSILGVIRSLLLSDL
jgi:hypothetical protein